MSKEKPDTKKCKHCQSDIPYNAKVCPNCRKKQGGKGKWIAIAIVVLLVLFVFAGQGDDEPDVKKVSGTNPESSSSVNKDSSKEGEDKDPEKESDSNAEDIKEEYVVGDIIETPDLRISFNSADKYVSDNEFIQPKKGNIYYKMDFEFENISDSDQYVSSFNFKCYADGYDMEQSYMDGMDLDATLSSGKKTKGSVFFEVPEDSKEITLEYETNFWSESKVVFKVK